MAGRIEEGLFRKDGVVDIKKARPLHHLGGQHFAALEEEINIS
jgi:hypothetical protein